MNRKEFKLRKKTLTVDCDTCDDMIINDSQDFECNWGKGGKILEPQKRKLPLECNLLKKGKPNEA